MNSQGAAKTPHYAGPTGVMIVREVSAYTARASIHDLPAAKAASDSGVSGWR